MHATELYLPAPNRYEKLAYGRSGKSGLLLPWISLGLWQNFGETYPLANSRALLRAAFDSGITHFDLANNYGPPPGAAEETFGKLFHQDFARYRDELIISTKSGYPMWPGPYGDWGSRKSLLASLDQSLKRLGLDYVDIYYSHRPDPNTPIEETMGALDQAVRSGKALYAGISNYSPEQTAEAASVLRRLGTPCLIHQGCYNLFDRSAENGLFKQLDEDGIGAIVFTPLAQGLLTDRYLNGIPADSRIARGSQFLKSEHLTEQKIAKVRQLNEIAKGRGQSLAQLATGWILRHPQVTSVLIGASKVAQIQELCAPNTFASLSAVEIAQIDGILQNQWSVHD